MCDLFALVLSARLTGSVDAAPCERARPATTTTTTTTAPLSGEMHSLRLRYVALGLLVYIQSAFARTCGTDFDDAASSAVAADTVLLATATRALGPPPSSASAPAAAAGHLRRAAARFRVERVYKGNIPAADVGDGGGRRKPTLVVGSFGARPDAARCVAPMVTPGRRYVLFLGDAAAAPGEVRTSTRLERRRQASAARRRRRMRISAFPREATDDVIEIVEQYANCSNRCRK